MTSIQRIDRDSYTAIRELVLEDPYAFAQIVCGHTDLSLETHRPLIYLAAGCGDKLIDLLDDDSLQSFTVRHLRKRFLTAGANWRTETGRQRFFELLDFVNIRVFRGAAKSSAITHAVTLWKSTRDPNLSQVIISNSEKNAIRFSKQIRMTILSDTYKALFPERVPTNPNLDMTEAVIRLGGRTRPDREASIMAFGYKSGLVGWHFDEFNFDDLVGEENSSPTELEGVRDFLGNVTGLYNPGKKYPIRRRHVGTRYDEEDDDAFLRRTGKFINVDIPIEYYPQGRADDITRRGTPTCPEWKDALAIESLQRDTLGDLTKGAWFWRANFLLDPSAGGGRLFTSELIESCLWLPVEKEENGRTRHYMARPIYDPTTKEPLYDKGGKQRYGFTAISAMKAVLGVDQAISMEDASDEWAVCVLGEDSSGVCFEIETRSGHGYEYMLDTILTLNDKYHPRVIGLEKGGMQDTTHFWLNRESRFGRLRGKVVPIPHNNKSKEWRLMNGIAEPMRMKRLYLNPKSVDLQDEMTKYRPGPKAKDNKLDALAIAMAASQRPANSAAVKRDVREWNRKRVEAGY